MYEYRRLTAEQRAELVRERTARGFPPHGPPHPLRDQSFYLLTAACYEHQPHMTTESRRRDVLDRLFQELTTRGIELRAWVVLPNHYHLLALLPNFEAVSLAFRLVHGATSRYWNLEDGIPGRRIWYGFTDRAIRSEAHCYTTINYLHYNPVKHGWTQSPYDWTESSVHWYVDHFGREWLRDAWARYPVRQYGKGWDEG